MKVKIKRTERVKRFRSALLALFSRTVFIVLLSASAISAIVLFILHETGALANVGIDDKFLPITFIIMVAAMALLSFITSVLIGKFPLKPVTELISALDKLAAGDFSIRLKFGKTLSKHKTFKEISDSFNKLAEELENTETLRSDFINNFSHEFKTPIVSIAGLAKLVNKGNLTEEQKKVYLTAIEEESMRLASMATNVLNLTKVENQSILTDVSSFNLSEQIRASVLLLENKWNQKNIVLSLDFDEHSISANEELLKQIWINLTDNAIKFSPDGGKVDIKIVENENEYTVKISNEGEPISSDNIEKIWNKFYQADESHASEGNGIGLAIVKKIVELHNGDVSVACNDNTVTFTVILPKEQ